MNRYFDSISQGLQEAAEYAQGNENGVKVHHIPIPDVKAIRCKIGMNENEFDLIIVGAGKIGHCR